MNWKTVTTTAKAASTPEINEADVIEALDVNSYAKASDQKK